MWYDARGDGSFYWIRALRRFFRGAYVNGFCFVFDSSSERFVRIGGDDYNYNRTEVHNFFHR
jgi:hypothetical protein